MRRPRSAAAGPASARAPGKGRPGRPRASRRWRCVALVLAALAGLAGRAVARQPALNSHQVNPDRSVTFRYYAPAAEKVTLLLDYAATPLALAKDAEGVWSCTTAPLAPALHFYGLAVDGVDIFDPLNADRETSTAYVTNEVQVPGDTPLPWDLTAVPHGVLHHHFYRTTRITGLPADEEDYYVYTPPGYDPAGAAAYPVLYLLHGWSSAADSWVTEGQANLMLDNLIAAGRVRPMIVVMPLGYGEASFAGADPAVWNDEVGVAANLDRFGAALLGEIVPQVERGYRTGERAIAGLSMGGGESLLIGLAHPGFFSWIGGFGSSIGQANFDRVLPRLLPAAAARLKLLWIAYATRDDAREENERFVAWLQAKGINPTVVETPGIHNWAAWRDNLLQFAPLLFRSAKE